MALVVQLLVFLGRVQAIYRSVWIKPLVIRG
uniref:Uncharacterized protein n=1 Tax=Arundo donax TaxID=35708 RepID=A0A0A9BVK6_ARUDO